MSKKRQRDSAYESMRKSQRRESSHGSVVLPEVCIFCGLVSKYKKGTNTREKLLCCSEFLADEKIRSAANRKFDFKILSIASDELIAKEARYHTSCYRDYTRPEKDKPTENDNIKLDILKDIIYNLLNSTNEKFVLYKTVKDRYINLLNNYDIDTTNCTKNLKRSIERNFERIKVVSVKNEVVLFEKDLKVEDVIEICLFLQEQFDMYEKMINSEKNIISCAKLIRNEIKNSNYRMPWPPSTHDLNVNNFIPPVSLNLFLTNLITSEEVNERTSRLISSFNQDIFFIVHCGKILTPKSILLPLHIKSLCNNKELITTVSRLGHGVSYTKLLEISTEVAYSKIEKQADNLLCLPGGCQKNMFSIVVEDILIEMSRH